MCHAGYVMLVKKNIYNYPFRDLFHCTKCILHDWLSSGLINRLTRMPCICHDWAGRREFKHFLQRELRRRRRRDRHCLLGGHAVIGVDLLHL